MWVAVALVLSIAYFIIILVYIRAWNQLKTTVYRPDYQPVIFVSVLIPARNEAPHILQCLQSILANNYPPHLFEIIVIDDESTDTTAALVSDFIHQNKTAVSIQLLRLPHPNILFSGKKAAITLGVQCAKGTLLMTTDADCTVSPDWIALTAQAHEQYPEKKGLGIGLVRFNSPKNAFEAFQCLDFAGLIGVTGAGIQLDWQQMGNGANLSYSKALFEQVGGFTQHTHRASGDDMFLIQQVASVYPESVFFIKNTRAVTMTNAQPDWRSFFQQRLRWGTKNAALPDWRTKAVLSIVFLLCWSIVLNIVLLPFFAIAAKILLLQLGIKALADYLFLGMLCRFFDQAKWMRWFLPAFFMHLFYIVVVGTASIFYSDFEWKGRHVQ